MKTVLSLFCLCATLYSCTGSDEIFIIDDGVPIGIENELLTDYPPILDSLIEQQFESKTNNPVSIISKKVYNLAIHQTEPTDKVFIDTKEFLIQVSAREEKSDKLTNYTLHFHKNSNTNFECLSFDNY